MTSGSGSTMGNGWRRARNALGLTACIVPQRDRDEQRSEVSAANSESGGAGFAEVSIYDPAERNVSSPAPISRSPSRLSVIRTSIRFSRVTCAICLDSMKPGRGQALFTAECSHMFHFTCIASNVRHGNLICPVCRANWREVPWQAPTDIPSFNEFLNRDPVSSRQRRTQYRLNLSSTSIAGEMSPDEEEEQRRADPILRILDESIANARGLRRNGPTEPTFFDDDEPLRSRPVVAAAAVLVGGERENLPANQQMPDGRIDMAANEEVREHGEQGTAGSRLAEIDEQRMGRQNPAESETRDEKKISEEIVVTCLPEVGAVPAVEERDAFTVLVHLKSSAGNKGQLVDGSGDKSSEDEGHVLNSSWYRELTAVQILNPNTRAPLDLVTVLDTSGSMAGTKLALLKQAMAFVIENLSRSDRLSVVAFSSSARRLFPLKRMDVEGRSHALRCVDALVCTGGTNIADGLKKGAKILEDRRMKNPVASIMLLSDGQDTYTIGNRAQLASGLTSSRVGNTSSSSVDGRRLLPGSLRHRRQGEPQVPVHTFGFGTDHDAATMHSIAEVSGGTFSFIQAEAAVQDAFAQCIGGLLSVISQSTTLSITTGAVGVQIKSIQAGSYATSISQNGSQGEVKLGDLYAEEERDILLELKLPAVAMPCPGQDENSQNLTTLLSVSCSFRDPVSRGLHRTLPGDVQISRPEVVDQASQTVSLEVDTQRNRMNVAQSILEAGHLADSGEISAAQLLLVRARDALHRSVAFQAGDHLSVALESELTAIQLRVANRQIYERTGRAYILSTQSSHFRQRATTRGDFSDNASSREYQTSSMADMVYRSQTGTTESPGPATWGTL